MSNDLERYSPGELAPYSPSQPLAPTAEDNWGQEVDYLSDHQQHSGGAQLFGQDVPGATPAQLQQALTEIAAVVASDMMRLGHPPQLIAEAADWLKQNAGKEPRQERIVHRFNLYQYRDDPATICWANHMHRAGADQTFIDNTLWLLDQIAAKLDEQQFAVSRDQPRTAPTSDPLDSLSDAEYAQVLTINEQAKAQTLDYLRDLWGSSFSANLSTVNSYFQSLPQCEQDHLSQMTGNWVAGTNTKEILLGLYSQAIGAGSISNSGAGISEEIAAIENLMVTDRKAYMKDERMQMRLRELYRRRGY